MCIRDRIIINPPIKLNCTEIEHSTNKSPKYIGFLVYLKTPLVTSVDAFSGFNGSTVVSCLLNERIADTKTNKPIKRKIILINIK